jgi:hypothetical protein
VKTGEGASTAPISLTSFATGTSSFLPMSLLILLRAESVASSKMEGLDASPRWLLDTEVVLAQGTP